MIQYRKHNVVHQPQGIPGVDSSRHLNQCYLRRNLSAKGAVTRILAAEGRWTIVKKGGGRSGIIATETNNTKAAIPDSNAGWWPSTSGTGLGRPDRRWRTSLYPVCALSGFETGPPLGIQAISKI